MELLSSARTAALLGAVSLIVGCSSETAEEGPRPAHQALFEIELERDLSDFSRAILEDKVITGAEFQEADARYVECVNEFFAPYDTPPFTSIIQRDGSLAHNFFGTDEEIARVDLIEPECLREYLGDGAIQYLYRAQIDGPDGESVHQRIIDCLVRKGLVGEEEYGLAELQGDINEDVLDPEFRPPGTDMSAATDLDLSSDAAFSCYAFQE